MGKCSRTNWRLLWWASVLVIGSMPSALGMDSKTNVILHASAKGWSLRPGTNNSTILTTPQGRSFNLGQTAYPDWAPTTLWKVYVEGLKMEFLLLHVPPIASGSVPLTVIGLKADGSMFRAADIPHHYEWDVNITTHQIVAELFVDSDSGGKPELVDNDVGKFGRARTYYILVGDKFVPRWKDVYKLDKPTGKVVKVSRELLSK
jgi:hypothetical protein